jgi:hypothetical protein
VVAILKPVNNAITAEHIPGLAVSRSERNITAVIKFVNANGYDCMCKMNPENGHTRSCPQIPKFVLFPKLNPINGLMDGQFAPGSPSSECIQILKTHQRAYISIDMGCA